MFVFWNTESVFNSGSALYFQDGKDKLLQNYFNPGQIVLESKDGKVYDAGYVKTQPEIVNCDDNIILVGTNLQLLFSLVYCCLYLVCYYEYILDH